MSKTYNFHNNLRILRDKKGLTQEELGKKMNRCKQAISAWEKRINIPSLDIFAEICEALDVTADELLFGSNKEQNIKTLPDVDFYTSKKTAFDTMDKIGFHTIMTYDLIERTGMKFDDTVIWAMAKALSDEGFNVTEVFFNGFSLYLYTNEEVKKINRIIDYYMDCIMHCNSSLLPFESHASYLGDEIRKTQERLIIEVELAIYGSEMYSAYYWVDELHNIRGYGSTVEECKKEAEKQNCNTYEIIKNCEEKKYE